MDGWGDVGPCFSACYSRALTGSLRGARRKRARAHAGRCACSAAFTPFPAQLRRLRGSADVCEVRPGAGWSWGAGSWHSNWGVLRAGVDINHIAGPAAPSTASRDLPGYQRLLAIPAESAGTSRCTARSTWLVQSSIRCVHACSVCPPAAVSCSRLPFSRPIPNLIRASPVCARERSRPLVSSPQFSSAPDLTPLLITSTHDHAPSRPRSLPYKTGSFGLRRQVPTPSQLYSSRSLTKLPIHRRHEGARCARGTGQRWRPLTS